MKLITAIVGIIGILAYIVWYNITYIGSIELSQVYKDSTYTLVYLSTSIAFFMLGDREKKYSTYWYMYSAIAEFWVFLGINMIVCTWIYSPYTYHLVVITLGIMLLLNIVILVVPMHSNIYRIFIQLFKRLKKWF